MRRLFFSLAAACAVLVGSPAYAAAAQTEVAGVWDGTIGDLPVRACFNSPDDLGEFGTYYYRSRLQLIYLRELKGARGTFVEGYEWEKKVPRWTFDKATEGQLSGRWVSGAKALSIRLARVSGPIGKDQAPCASTLFHQPRLLGLRVASKRAVKDGVRYRRLILEYPDHKSVGVESFALLGSTPAIRRINATLQAPFLGNPPEWHDCELSAGENDSGGGWDESFEPLIFTRRWLSVRQHVEAECGGPHPDSSNTSHTFDLQTGNDIDLSKWLNKSVGQRGFSRLLIANWTRGEDPECREVVEQSVRGFALDIELRRTGLAFTPNDLPHVVAACADEFFVPFAKLGPYLTADGRKNVAALQAEVASKR